MVFNTVPYTLLLGDKHQVILGDKKQVKTMKP